MHVLETTPEADERGLEIVRDQLLPWLRDSTGFRGLLRLTTREAGMTVLFTMLILAAISLVTGLTFGAFGMLMARLRLFIGGI